MESTKKIMKPIFLFLSTVHRTLKLVPVMSQAEEDNQLTKHSGDNCLMLLANVKTNEQTGNKPPIS